MRVPFPARSPSRTFTRRSYSSAIRGRFLRCHHVGRSRLPTLPMMRTLPPGDSKTAASSWRNRTPNASANRATYAGWSLVYSLFPKTAHTGALTLARIVRTTAPNASRSFRSVVSPASRNRSTGPSRLRSAVTAGRFSCPWTSPTAAMRTAAPNVGRVDEPFRPSEFADDRLTGSQVDDREACGHRLDVPHLLVRRLGLPRRRVHEDDPAILVHARGVHVARRKDVRDLLDDQVVFRLRRDRRLASIDRREVAHPEHGLHRVDRTRVAHPGDRGDQVVHAPAMVRQHAHAPEAQERRVPREDHVRVEEVLNGRREGRLRFRGPHGIVVPREHDDRDAVRELRDHPGERLILTVDIVDREFLVLPRIDADAVDDVPADHEVADRRGDLVRPAEPGGHLRPLVLEEGPAPDVDVGHERGADMVARAPEGLDRRQIRSDDRSGD